MYKNMIETLNVILDFYRTQVYRSMGPGVSPTPFADLTDVSLVNEDTNSILADDTDRAIPCNSEMQLKKVSL